VREEKKENPLNILAYKRKGIIISATGSGVGSMVDQGEEGGKL